MVYSHFMNLKVKVIKDCDFPIVEKVLDNYKVLLLPEALLKMFDEEGYHAIKIESKELASSLPDYGGRTTASYSLLPHQDHHPDNLMRFLALSKSGEESRRSITYLVSPDVLESNLSKTINYFHSHLDSIKKAFVFPIRSQIEDENDFKKCFDDIKGLDNLVEKKFGKSPDLKTKLFAYSGILTYLIQGEDAEAVVKKYLEENKDDIFEEEWDSPGILILDNSKVFHGRLGDNKTKLKRNWLIA